MISNRLPARMRALAMELKVLRAQSGLNTQKAAARIGTSTATLNRTEKAKRISHITDVAALLAVYGVTGPKRTWLLELAENLNAREWLETGDRLPHLLPALAGFEAEADVLVNFAHSIVPGLLQTPAYARALHASEDITGTDQEAMVAARLERQKVLMSPNGPKYVAILDEAVLRRPYGGSEVMAQQIHWLIGRARMPNLNILVIPFRHGGYPNPGMFSLFEFRSTPPIVYVETEAVSGFLDAPEEIKKFQGRAAKLVKVALGSADTVNFLTRMAADYERS
ncbi:helix-turn-helix domain-containing protein [Actinokineospora xionganensis]|uniref:Helix-turn-helix domain-containing protein n=1 Tax=Actinokineospora xionganensis TaxID=2684470 RepID=A0ABR7L2N7_9PSEU|nr:helix-turn-helix transcriptional regulator [Actinokineospora xionganensis]MBC6446951.1 helix-turn-helix domain-containing protein [Actinokineospora xionganensis]